jgi:putative FmdB family regulatory protein
MPVYEYRCQDCRKRFTKIESIAMHRPGKKSACPKCSGRRVERVYSSVYAVTSKKS